MLGQDDFTLFLFVSIRSCLCTPFFCWELPCLRGSSVRALSLCDTNRRLECRDTIHATRSQGWRQGHVPVEGKAQLVSDSQRHLPLCFYRKWCHPAGSNLLRRQLHCGYHKPWKGNSPHHPFPVAIWGIRNYECFCVTGKLLKVLWATFSDI